MNEKKFNVAVVGVTGSVGEVLLELLKEREFPLGELSLVASEHSAGEKLLFGMKKIMVQDIAQFDFTGVDFAFFSAGREVSKQYVPIATAAGAVVIDNTSEFRYEHDVPLIIPEINAALLAGDLPRNIIANPNCTTIQMLLALYPIQERVGIKRIQVATYQSVSGAGRDGIKELARQTATLLNGQEAEVKVLPHQIAFNIIPQIDAIEDNGYSREEMKMVLETQKIFNDPAILVNATAVRVPVFYGHGMALSIETAEPIECDEVAALMKDTVGLSYLEKDYPMPVTHAANQDAVFVGRLRRDLSHPQGLTMWVVADNVRKGAALNAIQIAELLVNKYRVLH
jgi:aspartate-semialdehyde dehydrogenase